jgi:DNA polymerase III subunit epsilon
MNPDSPGRHQRELPALYYRQHFLELLEFVAGHYGHVLDEEERSLIDQFRSLDEPAQCLYIRLVNRKGRVFDQHRLKYTEIGELGGPVGTLRERGWVASPDASVFDEVLGLLSRSQIQDWLGVRFPGLSRSMKKAQLVDFALTHCEPGEFTGAPWSDRLLVQKRTDWVRMLLFLYFGECRDSLSRFTMRDLGLVRVHSFRDAYEPRYADRAEAMEAFFFASRLAAFRSATGRERRLLIDAAVQWPEPLSEAAIDTRDELACAIGGFLEKAGESESALDFYRRGDSVQCTERLVRVLFSSGQREVARQRLEACIDEAKSEEEWLFAADLLERKFGRKRTSLQTDLLRSSEIIDLDEAHIGAPERAAVRYYQAQGQRAYRTENSLWRSLFGLLFWDELFSPDSAALHSPFEALPASLTDRSFYQRHQVAIEVKLHELNESASTRRKLMSTIARHYGTPNGVFRWRSGIAETIVAMLESADTEAVARMLDKLARDYPSMRYGWPDLLVIDEVGARFVEVKAEGDQLRRNQLLRLRQMRDSGLRADVVRVRWVLDPGQTYVVVDVETTGGRAEQHRITEIAALKLRNGEIIDRYETLINPQRNIPPGITRLTGISDAMVADAPAFVEIADAFEDFVGEAIFVAHNVNFDYGFVTREYARLGRQFRRAKLCTCASMRKLYPGYGSYSLAALCRRYEIPLESHHRAMCDAEAAAALLLIVNERRAADLRN